MSRDPRAVHATAMLIGVPAMQLRSRPATFVERRYAISYAAADLRAALLEHPVGRIAHATLRTLARWAR